MARMLHHFSARGFRRPVAVAERLEEGDDGVDLAVIVSPFARHAHALAFAPQKG
jgi:hypothetical protein